MTPRKAPLHPRYEMCVGFTAMRTRLRALLVTTAALAAQLFVSATPIARKPTPAANVAVPPGFVRNSGQADPLATYLSVGGSRPVFFTTNDVRIVDPEQHRSLWLTFVDGAARDIDGEWSTGGHVTVLRRASATMGEPIYRDVVYRDVWRGIDSRVSAASNGLKYSFEVSPGADPRAIHLRYSGVDRIELTAAGELVLRAGRSVILDTRPVAYQRVNGRMVHVPVRFVVFESDVAFSVGAYDRTQPLIIDPTLTYSACLGRRGDGHANAYVTGTTRSSDFPTTPGAYLRPATSGRVARRRAIR